MNTGIYILYTLMYCERCTTYEKSQIMRSVLDYY